MKDGFDMTEYEEFINHDFANYLIELDDLNIKNIT